MRDVELQRRGATTREPLLTLSLLRWPLARLGLPLSRRTRLAKDQCQQKEGSARHIPGSTRLFSDCPLDYVTCSYAMVSVQAGIASEDVAAFQASIGEYPHPYPYLACELHQSHACGSLCVLKCLTTFPSFRLCGHLEDDRAELLETYLEMAGMTSIDAYDSSLPHYLVCSTSDALISL